jgi:hypothetical protein
VLPLVARSADLVKRTCTSGPWHAPLLGSMQASLAPLPTPQSPTLCKPQHDSGPRCCTVLTINGAARCSAYCRCNKHARMDVHRGAQRVAVTCRQQNKRLGSFDSSSCALRLSRLVRAGSSCYQKRADLSGAVELQCNHRCNDAPCSQRAAKGLRWRACSAPRPAGATKSCTQYASSACAGRHTHLADSAREVSMHATGVHRMHIPDATHVPTVDPNHAPLAQQQCHAPRVTHQPGAARNAPLVQSLRPRPPPAQSSPLQAQLPPSASTPATVAEHRWQQTDARRPAHTITRVADEARSQRTWRCRRPCCLLQGQPPHPSLMAPLRPAHAFWQQR